MEAKTKSVKRRTGPSAQTWRSATPKAACGAAASRPAATGDGRPSRPRRASALSGSTIAQTVETTRTRRAMVKGSRKAPAVPARDGEAGDHHDPAHRGRGGAALGRDTRRREGQERGAGRPGAEADRDIGQRREREAERRRGGDQRHAERRTGAARRQGGHAAEDPGRAAGRCRPSRGPSGGAEPAPRDGRPPARRGRRRAAPARPP